MSLQEEGRSGMEFGVMLIRAHCSVQVKVYGLARLVRELGSYE